MLGYNMGKKFWLEFSLSS